MVVIFVVLCGANTIKFCISVIYHFIDFMNIYNEKCQKSEHKISVKSESILLFVDGATTINNLAMFVNSASMTFKILIIMIMMGCQSAKVEYSTL